MLKNLLVGMFYGVIIIVVVVLSITTIQNLIPETIIEEEIEEIPIYMSWHVRDENSTEKLLSSSMSIIKKITAELNDILKDTENYHDDTIPVEEVKKEIQNIKKEIGILGSVIFFAQERQEKENLYTELLDAALFAAIDIINEAIEINKDFEEIAIDQFQELALWLEKLSAAERNLK